MNLPIVIMTDFGITDPFVGIMKGVLSNIARENAVIDLTHEIPPGDIQRGAVTLWQSVSFFPRGSIFLAVVDPGVGTLRRPVVLKTQEKFFVGPDNGLFTFLLGKTHQAWEIQNSEITLPNPGRTFHGRDIFAPAAGHLARGVPGSEFGESISDLKLISMPKLESPIFGEIDGQILHADRFGNLLTNLGIFTPSTNGYKFKPWIGDIRETIVDLENSTLYLSSEEKLPWASTFGDIPKSECAFILGSSGLLEIVSNQQKASELLQIKGGEFVKLKTMPENQTGEKNG